MTNSRGFTVISPSDDVQVQINISPPKKENTVLHAEPIAALMLSMFYNQLIWNCLQVTSKQSMWKELRVT